MGSKREKYPEKCPWDLGPNQHLAKEENTDREFEPTFSICKK